jgi:hypothetical protein
MYAFWGIATVFGGIGGAIIYITGVLIASIFLDLKNNKRRH